MAVRRDEAARPHRLAAATASVLAEVRSPVDGVLFTLREYPLVYEGSLMARIMETRCRLSDGMTAPRCCT